MKTQQKAVHWDAVLQLMPLMQARTSRQGVCLFGICLEDNDLRQWHWSENTCRDPLIAFAHDFIQSCLGSQFCDVIFSNCKTSQITSKGPAAGSVSKATATWDVGRKAMKTSHLPPFATSPLLEVITRDKVANNAPTSLGRFKSSSWLKHFEAS